MLEEQLIPRYVGHAERDERPCLGQQILLWIVGRRQRRLQVDERLGRLREHRVQDRVLGLEVRVERWRRDARPARELAQGQGPQPVLAHQLPRGRQHVGPGTLPPGLTPVRGRFL